MNQEIILYQIDETNICVEVYYRDDTFWLTQKTMAELFDVNIPSVSKHLSNVFDEEELKETATVSKMEIVQQEGSRKVKRKVDFYNLDAVIAVGYRVNSKKATLFRQWATKTLKEYIIKGYAVNDSRMTQLNEVIRVMKRAENSLDAKQVLSVIEKYNTALDILDDYDHQSITRPKGNSATYTITYEECRQIIDEMKYGDDSTVFGNEKDQSFKGSIGAIYQSFSGEDVYPSLEEKAANLLYFVTKNHSFSDGNKRIAAAMFLFFLDKNNALFMDGEKVIADYTLVALTIMIAESKPEEKEMMTSIIMNCLNKI